MGSLPDGLSVGPDGVTRCSWADEPALYREYHDQEWGNPVHGDAAVFERLTLEAFQSGLSWLVILRKREHFRRAFAGFDPRRVARFDDRDVDRLLADVGIVRNRAKILAAIGNAGCVVELLEESGPGALDQLLWRHRPARGGFPRSAADVPRTDPAADAFAEELRRRGFRFLGPVTAYAGMQAMGLVDDHVVGCHRSGGLTGEPLA